MNKRARLLALLDEAKPQEHIPAAFFLHFDADHRSGEGAIEKHKEFFRFTGMDFVKIQFELNWPTAEMRTPDDWANLPFLKLDFYEPQLEVVRGLVRALGKEALVLLTLYSPFMCAANIGGADTLDQHLSEDPERAAKGIAIAADSLLLLVRQCINIGIDGFYHSTQGGEDRRFSDRSTFTNYVKPYDLAVMREIDHFSHFNILHVCDYHRDQYGGYSDLGPFVDYPGQIVNCALEGRTPAEISRTFGRPFMGGLNRKGPLATGTEADVRQAAKEALKAKSPKFILGADCTVPGNTPWTNLRAAIDEAHKAHGVLSPAS